jgi:hypothetical protein
VPAGFRRESTPIFSLPVRGKKNVAKPGRCPSLARRKIPQIFSDFPLKWVDLRNLLVV